MKVILAAVLMGGLLTACTNQEQNKKEENMTTLNLTQEWDKVFTLSEKVNHCKVTFETQYGLTLAADLYTPAASEKLKDKKCYTLQGTLAQAGHKGIIIQNGKKIIRKQ